MTWMRSGSRLIALAKPSGVITPLVTFPIMPPVVDDPRRIQRPTRYNILGTYIRKAGNLLVHARSVVHPQQVQLP